MHAMATIDKLLPYNYINLFFVTSIISITIIVFIIKQWTKTKSSSIRRPPSPLALPIIGHLHLLTTSLPESFQTLARRYGPLMRLRLGQPAFIVVSDAATAKQILRVHDAKFASRFELGVADFNIYKDASFVAAPYGPYWRFMRKLCMTKLLDGPQLKRFNHIREEEIGKLVKSLKKRWSQGEWCDLSGELARFTNNLIFRMMMSKGFAKDEEAAEEMGRLLVEIMGLAAKLGVNEVLGVLKRVDPFGNGKKLRDALERYDRFVEEIMKDYEEKNYNYEGGNINVNEDVLDILLKTYRDNNAELKLTRNQIKFFIFDLFAASIDTSRAAIQWAMAELINHPQVLKKLREEIDSVVKSNRLVNESDVPNLPYLQAIAKETLRLHSPAPIIHRECNKDCNINGFDIQANDRVLINAYAIMRHPDAWQDPDKYMPERFLDGRSNGEFWFLPFGGGRRLCAGSLHAYLIMHATVGALVQCFDWKPKDGDKVDLSVGSGFLGSLALPMDCYPILRFDPFQES